MAFPTHRLRRLRSSPAMRALVCETRIHPDNFITPLFVVPGSSIKKEITSLPGQYHFSLDMLAEQASRLYSLGLKSVLLFGIPESKDPTGSAACKDDGIIQRAIAIIKKTVPEMLVITDLCFCEYTSHGHCGVMKDGILDNDATLPLLAQQALSHARAGANMIAPSGMLDGAVASIRRALEENAFANVAIMAYAAKFASAYYGPFREAVASAPEYGDRRGYQMNPANLNEALKEVALDIEEGADIVMVKPALAYLDVIRAVKQRFEMPTAAYNVSGEYSMIKMAAAKGIIDGESLMLETLVSIKRAGADMIISYFSEDFAKLYKAGKVFAG